MQPPHRHPEVKPPSARGFLCSGADAAARDNFAPCEQCSMAMRPPSPPSQWQPPALVAEPLAAAPRAHEPRQPPSIDAERIEVARELFPELVTLGLISSATDGAAAARAARRQSIRARRNMRYEFNAKKVSFSVTVTQLENGFKLPRPRMRRLVAAAKALKACLPEGTRLHVATRAGYTTRDQRDAVITAMRVSGVAQLDVRG